MHGRGFILKNALLADHKKKWPRYLHIQNIRIMQTVMIESARFGSEGLYSNSATGRARVVLLSPVLVYRLSMLS